MGISRQEIAESIYCSPHCHHPFDFFHDSLCNFVLLIDDDVESNTRINSWSLQPALLILLTCLFTFLSLKGMLLISMLARRFPHLNILNPWPDSDYHPNSAVTSFLEDCCPQVAAWSIPPSSRSLPSPTSLCHVAYRELQLAFPCGSPPGQQTKR